MELYIYIVSVCLLGKEKSLDIKATPYDSTFVPPVIP